MAASWLALVGTLVVYHSLEAAATKIHEQRRFFILFHLPDQLFCRGKTDFITNFFHQLHGDGLTIKIAIKAEQMGFQPDVLRIKGGIVAHIEHGFVPCAFGLDKTSIDTILGNGNLCIHKADISRGEPQGTAPFIPMDDGSMDYVGPSQHEIGFMDLSLPNGPSDLRTGNHAAIQGQKRTGQDGELILFMDFVQKVHIPGTAGAKAEIGPNPNGPYALVFKEREKSVCGKICQFPGEGNVTENINSHFLKKSDLIGIGKKPGRFLFRLQKAKG